jgi:predicted ATP-grasp superfamily ATP-dependent carboligase
MKTDANPKPIFVHEFIAGGGWAGEELPPGLLAEGYAMLRAVLTDFQRWGRFPTLTTLDARLSHRHVPVDRVEIVEPGGDADLYPALVAVSQAVLIIAPETAGILKRLTATVETLGVQLLGSSSGAVETAGDKLACYWRFRQAGLPTPRTRHAHFDENPRLAAGDLRYPLVIKPVDGVGCEGVVPVNGAEDLPAALARMRSVTQRHDFLVTEYVPGTPASVSLFVTRTGTRPLTLNSQHIIVTDSNFAYRGGTVPLTHPLRQQAFAVAVQAVSLIPGLRGYVGVDLVLTDEEAFVIEINPRLTTSYIGIRQVIDLNLAEAIWLACVEGQLPPQVTPHGQVTFTRDNLALNPDSEMSA